MEGTGVKEVGRLSARLELVGTESENVGRKAGLEECGFVGRYSGCGRLGRSGHGSESGRTLRLFHEVSVQNLYSYSRVDDP